MIVVVVALHSDSMSNIKISSNNISSNGRSCRSKCGSMIKVVTVLLGNAESSNLFGMRRFLQFGVDVMV